jgi:hypothetical protein
LKEYFAFQTTIGRLIQTAYYNTDYAYGKKRREEKRREAIDTCLMLRITPSAADAS